MVQPATTRQTAQNHALTYGALTTLAAMAMLAMGLLLVPLNMPIGANYWDLFLYLDATQRINDGQIPSVDFFAPVGALGYYLAAAFVNFFENGQPLLAVSWSLMVVTAPLMAAIAIDGCKRKPLTTFAVTLSFAVFAFLPFNTTPGYTFPGSDGFAIYNRQTSQLIFVLVAALLLVRTQWLMALLVGLTMAALFHLKVTGFLAAGLICLLALLTGRISVVATGAAIALFIAINAALELALNGLVSAYLADIATLVSMNESALLPRLLQAASKTIATTLAATALGFILLAATLADSRRLIAQRDYRKALDHPTIWLAVVLVAGLFFESQNTGGQELTFLWPVIIWIVASLHIPGPKPALTGVTLLLAATTIVPLTANTLQAALRSTVGSLKQQPLEHTHLRQMGQISGRPFMMARAFKMREIYITQPDMQQAFNDIGLLPSFQLYSDFDFHLLNHITADEAVARLKQLEEQGLAYQSVAVMNFANPFGWLLGKDAPRHIAIGADPSRAVPPLKQDAADAMSATDLVLIPTCPYAFNTVSLLAHYEQPLANHRRVSLTPCFDALVHPDIDFAF